MRFIQREIRDKKKEMETLIKAFEEEQRLTMMGLDHRRDEVERAVSDAKEDIKTLESELKERRDYFG